MSLIVTCDGVDPVSGEKVEFYCAAGGESNRQRLWGTAVIRRRFPMLAMIEHDLNVKPNEFGRFEQEASRLAAEAGDVAVELGWGEGGAEELLRYAAACTDAVDFARKYDSAGIWYW